MWALESHSLRCLLSCRAKNESYWITVIEVKMKILSWWTIFLAKAIFSYPQLGWGGEPRCPCLQLWPQLFGPEDNGPSQSSWGSRDKILTKSEQEKFLRKLKWQTEILTILSFGSQRARSWAGVSIITRRSHIAASIMRESVHEITPVSLR